MGVFVPTRHLNFFEPDVRIVCGSCDLANSNAPKSTWPANQLHTFCLSFACAVQHVSHSIYLAFIEEQAEAK